MENTHATEPTQATGAEPADEIADTEPRRDSEPNASFVYDLARAIGPRHFQALRFANRIVWQACLVNSTDPIDDDLSELLLAAHRIVDAVIRDMVAGGRDAA